MADGDEEPLTENEKHALRNSTVTEDGRHVCGKTRRVEGQPMILLTLTHLAGDEVSWILFYWSQIWLVAALKEIKECNGNHEFPTRYVSLSVNVNESKVPKL